MDINNSSANFFEELSILNFLLKQFFNEFIVKFQSCKSFDNFIPNCASFCDINIFSIVMVGHE